MRVYVIRHGQSQTNQQKTWTGWMDVPLTAKGIEDARNVGEMLKNVPFDKVYASDLIRAVETARNVLPGKPVQTTSLLRELDVGTLAGKPWSFLTDEDRARIFREGYVRYGGESQRVFYDRVLAFKKELEGLDAENVAVFSHNGWVRAMLDTVLEVRLPRKHMFCNNCAVTIYEYNKNLWKLHSWINL